ncbi:MAG: molybdopterin-dependent oxidoreductase [Spirochaetaceae bacterium]|nr:molybdopterin-dependent oxidoreductase [Spirochaetaceae bacterium]
MKEGDQGRFLISDFTLRGSLSMVTIRSPVARGRLLGIDCPSMPSSYTLIQASDIPGKNLLKGTSLPVLASDSLSYIGEPVALLAGPVRSKLESYAEQITVRAEAAQGVFAPDAAGEAVLARRSVRMGDPETAFAGAETIVEGHYTTGMQAHWYAEHHGAAALPSSTRLLIYTSTQWPFHVRAAAAQVLNMAPKDILIHSGRLGVQMDGKIWYPSLIASHAALAAFLLKKPVRIILTHQEDFFYAPKRHNTGITIKSALGKKGEITATMAEVTADTGAGGVFTDEVLDRICLGALGAYRYENLDLSGAACPTNTPPRGPFSGFGLAQGFFAAERHASKIAGALHEDPAEWRKNHAINAGAGFAIGVTPREMPSLDSLLDCAASMSDYNRKWASYELLRNSPKNRGEGGGCFRGIGIALAYQDNGFFYNDEKEKFSVELTLDKEGKLEIKTSMADEEENNLIWRRLAAEQLSLDLDAVSVGPNSTDKVPDSGPACLSRNIITIPRLIELAAAAIRKQRFRDPLPITVRRSAGQTRTINWNNAPIDQTALSHPGWAAGVVEIEMDPVTFAPVVRGMWLAVDGGKVISEERARRYLKFSMIHALDWASGDDISYSGGLIPGDVPARCCIPLAGEYPPMEIDFLWSDALVSKGLGDLPYSVIPAAYAQAVSQALDYSFEKLPLTAGDIWAAMRRDSE